MQFLSSLSMNLWSDQDFDKGYHGSKGRIKKKKIHLDSKTL